MKIPPFFMFVCLMVFNATVNNISVISWWFCFCFCFFLYLDRFPCNKEVDVLSNILLFIQKDFYNQQFLFSNDINTKEISFVNLQKWWNSMTPHCNYVHSTFVLRFTIAPTQSVICDQKMSYIGKLCETVVNRSQSYDQVYDLRPFVKWGPGQQSWISNCLKKMQHFFWTPKGTIVVSLVAGYAIVVLKKMLQM